MYHKAKRHAAQQHTTSPDAHAAPTRADQCESIVRNQRHTPGVVAMAGSSSPDESHCLFKKRKLSWVGVDEDTPYAFLREAMVSDLMGGICEAQSVSNDLNPKQFHVNEDRKRLIEAAIGQWSFSAHDFTDDELLHGDLTMLQHALQLPELDKFRMSIDDLTVFLLASRAAYNDFVLYHNFRHISDVLQAVFFFLVSIGALPPYPHVPGSRRRTPCAIGDLIKPFDALTLLISAIGHDVGHPGVNNAFLVALNAPLAQLYNDRSVLESFHCAAYSQILRRHWPQAFSDPVLRKLMIEVILATDMGMHFKYMTDLGHLQEKLAHNGRTTDGWSVKVLEEYRDLVCGLLIKCADISNIARKFDVAATWAHILTDEFSNQGQMESRLNLPTCLFGGPPVQGDMIKLGQSQLGFMNVFARPLFEAVTDILPAMQFSVDELSANKARWDGEIRQEEERRLQVASQSARPGQAPGLLHFRGLRGGRFDGAIPTPSPKTSSVEFMLHPPEPMPDSVAALAASSTSAPCGDKQQNGLSAPHPYAAAEAQAEAKRRIFNPSNADMPLSPSADQTRTPLTNGLTTRPTSMPDASLSTSMAAYLDKKKKGDKKRESGKDGQTRGCGPVLRSLSQSKRKNNNNNNSAGETVAGNGTPAASPLNGTESRSLGDVGAERKPGSPQDSGVCGEEMARVWSEPGSASGGGGGSRSGESDGGGGGKTRKFGLGKFWRRRWRNGGGGVDRGEAEEYSPSGEGKEDGEGEGEGESEGDWDGHV